MTDLPVEAVLPRLRAALEAGSSAVLVAPPGAGKTTRVPLALLDAPWRENRKLIVLSPRRLAARAAAERMAATLGEPVGETVGYRVRMEQRVSARTAIEVVTEGVFTRRIQADPELADTAAVLFDEAHERALEADLGLALALDAQAALRPDLRLLPMSATLDGARVAALLDDAPVIESQGRMFPIETRYRPRNAEDRLENAVADAVLAALREEPGSQLVFLPGAGEIARTAERLAPKLDAMGIALYPLHGSLEPAEQRAAIAPGPRKVVLATAIAETSLTIEGVRVVIDSGLARRPRYDPSLGLTHLVTERVSQAAADQRRGRAGRLEPGVCIRLWEEGQTRALPAFDPPEIREADLSGLLLDLAVWGVRDPLSLKWQDPPPAAALQEARSLLEALGALAPDGAVTAHGRTLAELPLPPRLAHMLAASGEDAPLAARIAMILTERGLGGRDTDLRHRLRAAERDRSPRAQQALRLAGRWAALVGGGAAPDPDDAGRALALAYPERVARQRGAGRSTYLMANGRAASLDAADPLAREPWLAVAEVTGRADRSTILLAAPIAVADDDPRIIEQEDVTLDPRTGSVRAARVRRLGAIALAEKPILNPEPMLVQQALIEGLAGPAFSVLGWTEALMRLRARVNFLHARSPEHWPDWSDDALKAALADWLGPYLAGVRRLDQIAPDMLRQALEGSLDREQRRALATLAPDRLETPAGTSHAIDYTAQGGPAVEVRVQELFGLTVHPMAGGEPLTLVLLSPGHKPIQTTRDLPGFWRGSWAEVKTEMKGRYPKHVWPDDPAIATATTRAKPRGT